MQELETGKEKIQKICDVLKKETLEPARQEAKEIIENAHMQAEEILEKASKKGQKLIEEAKEEMKKEKKVFDAAINLSCVQTLDELRQKIEEKLFSDTLHELIEKASKDPDIIARFLTAIINAIEKEGIDRDISAYVSKEISPREVNERIAGEILDKLKEKEILLADFAGGVKVKLRDKNITIDISGDAIKEFAVNYLREDFRQVVFNA